MFFRSVLKIPVKVDPSRATKPKSNENCRLCFIEFGQKRYPNSNKLKEVKCYGKENKATSTLRHTKDILPLKMRTKRTKTLKHE